MRISTSMQYQRHLNYLQLANTKVDNASTAYNTGKKFQTAGDNPGGMSASIKYAASMSQYKQYTLNSQIVSDTLKQEETALGQIYDCMSSIQTRLVQAINGTLDDGARAALAEEIEQVRDQIFNLMNTKNSEGDYIFSGAQSAKPTYVKNADGTYSCQADGSAKFVNVSPELTVQTTDSGLNIFENVTLSNTFTAAGKAQGGADKQYLASISDYDQFNTFFKDYYQAGTGGADNGKNTLKITVEADNKFKLEDQNGKVVSQGTIKDGKMIVQGMTFELPDGTLPAVGDTIDITLNKPKQDNILNQLNSIVTALKTPQDEYGKAGSAVKSSHDLVNQLSAMQINVSLSKTHVDTYRGLVGARGSNIDDIITINETLYDTKAEANANVTEVDAFTAVSDLLQAQNALSVAQQSFQVVHSATLFDYM